MKFSFYVKLSILIAGPQMTWRMVNVVGKKKPFFFIRKETKKL